MKKTLLVIGMMIVILTACGNEKTSENVKDEAMKYLKEVTYDDLSIEYLVTDILGNSNDFYLEELSISFTADGHISILNLNIQDKDQALDQWLIYRSDNNSLVVSKDTLDINTSVWASNKHILEIFDEQMPLSVSQIDSDDVIRYELLVPSIVSTQVNTGDYVDNARIEEAKKVEGLVFMMYKIPIEKDDQPIYYVYTE